MGVCIVHNYILYTTNYGTINRQCMYICHEIYHWFVQALETGRKASLWQAFLACFAMSVNNDIFTINVHMLCLSCNVKKSKTTAKLYWEE